MVSRTFCSFYPSWYSVLGSFGDAFDVFGLLSTSLVACIVGPEEEQVLGARERVISGKN